MNAPIAPSRRRARNDLAQSFPLASKARRTNRSAGLKQEVVTLLSEIMARLRGVDMPVVQFIRASDNPDAAAVAASFAQACARCIGRTLLIRLGPAETVCVTTSPAAVSVATIPRRRTRRAPADNLDIVPDSFEAGLCHARLGCEYGDAAQMVHALPDTWLDGVALDFKVIVIESDAPERCPATLDLATRCHGSVLVVTAGATGLPQARRVMRQVQIAGGTLLGSVLDAAPPPPRLFAWFRRQIGKSAG